MIALDFAVLAARLAALAREGRAVVGIAGPPGVGKSTVAASLAEALGRTAVVLPLDGFHFTQAEIAGTPLAATRGAPDTFDAAAYLDCLARVRADPRATVRAPGFSRTIEDPVPDAITIGPEADIVITEGNYLLLADQPWPSIRRCLDECWYLENDDEVRRRRLVARHIEAGKEPRHAHDWTHGTDEANARLIRLGRDRADLVIRE